jgi:hypothetical protein
MQTWKHWSNGSCLEVLDSTIRDSYSRNDVIRCIHIGLLCVQENPTDRPTMATIVLMLSSYTVTLPSPQKPPFFLHSRIEPSMPIKELESDESTSKSSNQSTSKLMQWSANETSITEVHPR